MANVLTTGAWLSAPNKKPSFFARLLRAHIESGERRANRVAEAYIAAHGLQKLSDDAERQIGRLLAKACLLYTSPSPRDRTRSRMPSSA